MDSLQEYAGSSASLSLRPSNKGPVRVWPRGGERLSTCRRRSRRRPSTHAAADWPVLRPPGVVGTLLSRQIACGKFRFERHTSFQPVCRLEVIHVNFDAFGSFPGFTRAFSSEVDTGSREENASKQETRAPFRFNRNGKGSRKLTQWAASDRQRGGARAPMGL